MFYSNGKILIHAYNSVEKLEEAAEKIADYIMEEKGFEAVFVLTEHEKHKFPYYEVPEGVHPLDLDAALRPHIALRAINEDTFKMFQPLKVQVKHVFNDKELSEFGLIASQKYLEIKKLEVAKSNIAKEYKSKIDSLDAEINELATKQENGYELKDVEAIIKYNFKEGVKYYMHAQQPDTVLKTEKLDHKDYQLRIDHTDFIPEKEKTIKEGDEIITDNETPFNDDDDDQQQLVNADNDQDDGEDNVI